MKTQKANDLVESQLDQLNLAISTKLSAEVIVLRSAMSWGVDDNVRDYIEDLKQKNGKHKKLCVLLESTGGYIEVVERIYAVFRKHYGEVIFVVPNYAYSAGTVLVLSGDEIYMDYYSVLGPIDPQFESEDGRNLLPGIGYLQKFNELVDTINEKQKRGEQVTAEMAYLVKRFEPSRLFHIEQAREHSERLLKEWLPKHKFRNWTVTETTKKPVDQKYKEQRAEAIAQILGDPSRWHSHGRGISRKDLQSEEIKLRIEDLEADQGLNVAVRQYYDLLIDYCRKQSVDNVMHGNNGMRIL